MTHALPAAMTPLTHAATEGSPVLMPQLGLGTYKISDDAVQPVVEQGLEIGYRHLDTAQMYGNEAGVGRAIAAIGLPREELFVTSKLDNPHHAPADVARTFEETMERLGLEVLDLFLVHWPLAKAPGLSLERTWEAMIRLRESGRVRAIGVSNYQADHLRTIIEATGVVPAVNQIEIHPYLQQRQMRAVHEELGIVTQSWSPLARGLMVSDPVVQAVARELEVSPAQVVVRWHLQHGLVVIPKSVHAERLRANAQVFGFSLSAEQMEQLDSLERGHRTGSHPDTMQL
ncbi:aldo/keto reductase [Actinomyces urogenitalis]|jgi:2,5-diketo-D-gluconate reductase A|uniref:aldo/keto reductase n=1 Tax=Actinomyces urogenitalis TaxID=103621 RepID=UPI00050F42A8|nr:aldo/keto reductase [Actinomyces urogenitalis]KGF04451.1 oxidoreductase [Actinomyces urogenitalis S6-C4]KGF04488.1 oxidoreductase [Actinomyces urogenitalis S6-C4]MDU0865042.1 aldo/keto reductase [Actinomyces urogenitalis]MDU0875494.1 aldo/keto reductase [Actinomyces urogenitalis]MDU1564657.1 aldo/keto reductase [Actinomyces urogenitalis]